MHLNFHLRGNVWFTAGISSLSFSGGRTLVCGYTEGQVLFSKPAYGGSSYVNPECALLYESESGVRSGDGLLCLQSKAIGYQETLQLKGVRATDLAAPGKIPENVVREALDRERIRTVSYTHLQQQKSALDRSITFYQLGMLGAVLGIILYACVGYMFRAVVQF